MKLIFLSLLVTVALGMDIESLGDNFMVATKYLQVREIFLFASCTKHLYTKITKNLSHFVNDDLNFFKHLCEKNFEGYGKLEARVNWVRSSFKINKMRNGNFQIFPMNHFRADEIGFIVDVKGNLLKSFGDKGWAQFKVDLPTRELILSCVQGGIEYRFADVSSYPDDFGTNFEYSKYPFLQPCKKMKASKCHLLGGKQISITPQNIDKFFHLCANPSPQAIIATRLVYKPNHLRFMFWTAVSATILSILSIPILSNPNFSLLPVSVALLFFLLPYIPIRGRLARFMHTRVVNRILLTAGVILIYFFFASKFIRAHF